MTHRRRPTKIAAVFAVLMLLTSLWASTQLAAQVSNAEVAAWGLNHRGQTNVPDALSGVVAIDGSHAYHSLALLDDGTVVGWGQVSVPPGLIGVTAISGGEEHDLALLDDGTVVAWGSNWAGESDVPAGLVGVVAIAAGDAHSLALRGDGTVVAWGWNGKGQTDVPDGLSSVIAISGGSHHSLALHDDGTVTAWGWNLFGQADVPPGLTNVIAIDAGGFHNLALLADGTVTAWGDDQYGQSDIPSGITDVTAVSGGHLHSLALRSDGTVSAWGFNGYQQTNVPMDLGSVTAISAGRFHNLSLRIINTAPSADAGGPYTGTEGLVIPLVGANAFDADLDPLTYAWSVDSGSCSFDEATVLNPELTCTDDGTFGATLTVDDGTAPPVVSEAMVLISNVAPTIDDVTGPVDPVDMNDELPVEATVVFTDPGTADSHDVTWDWGDSVIETHYGVLSPAMRDHSYVEPGVYPVTVTVVDDDGGNDTATFEYVVIYDPADGFVTGGGWIDSPDGAFAEDPDLAGRATFGFVSKYKKGASVPTGNTEFLFHAGDLDFHSDSYDWLVIAGHDRAKYKGDGTINGSGDYGFMLTAVDNGSSGDTFRIRIWDNDNGDALVYDNKTSSDNDGYDGTDIGGGNIKVHKK